MILLLLVDNCQIKAGNTAPNEFFENTTVRILKGVSSTAVHRTYQPLGTRIDWRQDILRLEGQEGKLVRVSYTFVLPHKIRNKKMKSYNGNRVVRNILKLAQWNIGNSKWESKRLEIEALALEKSPDIILISEANLWRSLPEEERSIAGYNLHFPTAMMNKHGYARIVLLAKVGLEVEVHNDIMHEDLSVIWVSLKYSSRRKMKLGGIYREHQLLFQDKPNPTLTDAAQLARWSLILEGWKKAATDPHCTVLGDMNLDYLTWQNPKPSHLRMVNLTKDEIETKGFSQLIKGHTRTWRGQRDSLVDHCWSARPDRIISWLNETRGRSDHNYIDILLRTKDKKERTQEVRKRTWKNFQPDIFREMIKKIDWENFYECNNIDVINDIFEQKVGGILEKIAPMKKIQLRQKYANWLDSEIKQKMTERDNMREAAKESDNDNDWRNYKQARNHCTKMLQKKKKEFYKKKFENHCSEKNVKGTYDLAKKLMGWGSSTHPTMFLIKGKIFRKPTDLANELQKFYTEKINNLIRGLKRRGRDPLNFLKIAMNNWQGKVNLPSFNLREISELETLTYIKKLSNSSAYGRDDLDAVTLKIAAGLLVKPLTHIVNTSLRMSTFANKWKMSKVIPILKSSDSSRLEPSSYRPVSILPVVSKLVERSVQVQMQEHMEREGLISMNSHAYRKNLSTATALMQLVDELHSATEKNQISQLLALDQKAAFDLVSHNILIDKLRIYGCSTKTIQWMRNYLDYRSQYISVGSHHSKIVSTCRGVPQGSILGPLLYLLYTNKINEVIKNPDCRNSAHDNKIKLFGNNCDQCGRIITYADDTTYHIANKQRESNKMKIEENMLKLEDFLTDNELVINAEKTAILEAMIKQKKGRLRGEPPQLMITTTNGTRKVITDKGDMRILGANLEQNMGWMSHLERGKKATLPAVRKLFGTIQQIGRMLPRGSKKLLIEGLLISKMSYVISQWGGAPSNQIRLAQRLQNKCARWVTGCGSKIRITSLLEEVGWMSIREMAEQHSLVQMWKVLHLNKPTMIREKIEVDQDMMIEIAQPRLEFTLQSFIWRTSLQWNNLPQNMRELDKISAFKIRLKVWMRWRRDSADDSDIEPD